jgi:excisionase family DNA binding protein
VVVVNRLSDREVHMRDTNAPTKADQEPLWNAEDVAHFLKVSRSWVYQRAESGELPHLRVGGLIRFDPATVRAFANGGAKSSKVLVFPSSPSGKSG